MVVFGIALAFVLGFVLGLLTGHKISVWAWASRIEEIMSPAEIEDLNSRIKARFG
jgi:hypothetical protein